MARITAVIDIGSNSARMVIFERTSRYGFHLLHEIKSKVRISEGAYQNEGHLQPHAIERAIHALHDFQSLALSYGARKILCVATSAVRDAPNRQDFLSLVKKQLGLSIRVIEGEKESYYGAVSAVNLLPVIDGVTVDIGGGSTELALIKNKRIISTVSLPLGTVRLKELFSDKGSSLKKAQKLIDDELANLPADFCTDQLIAIGGTNRAIATAIMADTKYPIDTLHGYCYTAKEKIRYCDKILSAATDNDLRKLKVKEERMDVMKEGSLIIKTIIEKLGCKEIIVSGAGVREGVFLVDILGQNPHFPPNLNPSVRSLQDRFGQAHLPHATALSRLTGILFDTLSPLHQLSMLYRSYIDTASRLTDIGSYLSFYNKSTHAFYFVLTNLNYGFTHQDKLIVANIIKYAKSKQQKSSVLKKLKEFDLPEVPLLWCSTLLSLAQALYITRDYTIRYTCALNDTHLTIQSNKKLPNLIHESIAKLQPLPLPLTIEILEA